MSTLALCIPAYNAAQYLPALLSSATDQAIPFDEIWVYNDCSRDDTHAVAEKYGAKVIDGDINRGCSWGKNQLAKATTCNWIHFHDADDVLLPNFTTLAHKWMDKPDCADVVLFSYEYRDYITDELLNERYFDAAALKKDAIAYTIANQINPFCGLYKRSHFISAGGYDIDPEILYYEDSAFHIKMALAGLTFDAESEISIINYRLGSSMSGANINKCLTAQYHVFENTAKQVGRSHGATIAAKLWNLAGLFAAVNNWPYVKRSIQLTETLGYKTPLGQRKLFTALTYIDPLFAVWFREKAIRLFKPELRKNA